MMANIRWRIFVYAFFMLMVCKMILFLHKWNSLQDKHHRWPELIEKRKSVLVTGGAGFIGHHVLMYLKVKGIQSIGIDNFNNYYDISLKYTRANISGNVVNMDVCDSVGVGRLINIYNITHIIHLAAQAGVRYSIKHPEAYIRSNVECFLKLLEVIKFREISLIYASSSSVYGKNTKIPFSENDRVDFPASLYAATKRNNELLASVYWNIYKLRSVGLRFFTVYGPMGRPDMAYYSFAKQIDNNTPIDVYNHGQISRDFTYIDDVVDGIVSCLDFYFECEILNLGLGEPQPLMLFISKIEALLGKKAIINYQDISKADVLLTYADVRKARYAIDYHPKISLEIGLQRFIHWYKQSSSSN